MNILEKLDQYKEVMSQVHMIIESGVFDMKRLSKTFREAEVYFHVDL